MKKLAIRFCEIYEKESLIVFPCNRLEEIIILHSYENPPVEYITKLLSSCSNTLIKFFISFKYISSADSLSDILYALNPSMIKFIDIGYFFPRFTDSSLTQLFLFKKLETLKIGRFEIEDDKTDNSKYQFLLENILI